MDDVELVYLIVPYCDRFAREQQMCEKHLRTEVLPALMQTGRQREVRAMFTRMPASGAFNIGAARNLSAMVIAREVKNTNKGRTTTTPESSVLLVFLDVDKLPASEVLIDARPDPGTVKQIYGASSLHVGGGTGCGIFSLRLSDFRRAGGFPNFWSWGMEDVEFTRRVMLAGLSVDKSTQIAVGDPRVMHMYRGPERHFFRVVNRVEMYRFATGSAIGDTLANVAFRDEDVTVSAIDDGSGGVAVQHVTFRAFTTGTTESPRFSLPIRIDRTPLAVVLGDASSLVNTAFSVQQQRQSQSQQPSQQQSSRNRLQSLFGAR